jgi:hypothetical protein
VTVSENFVSRWARLKRSADLQRRTEPRGDALPRPTVEVSAGGAEAAIGQPGIDAAFDPASLPSIETISVNTDIRGFLQSRVPAELMQAALRRVWASDPAIRDFIGIAENQWDFNDPTAMLGFGPMLETDNMPALLARALGGGDKLAGMIPEIPALKENALPAVAEREPVNPDLSLQQSSERQPVADEICNLPDDNNESTAIPNDRVVEEDDSSRSYRSHGSALPR